MFHNYFFLKRLSDELDRKISGGTIASCFSQQKDELVLGIILKNNDDFYIKATLDNEINLVSFPSTFHRAKKNSIDLFDQVIDSVIESVEIVPFDRSFYLKLSTGDRLLFKLHGNRSNIILIGEENILFKSKLKNDQIVSLKSIANAMDLNNLSDDDLIKLEKVCGKEIQQKLESEKKYSSLTNEEKKKTILSVIEKVNSNPICLIKDKKPAISLLYNDCERSIRNSIDAANALFKEIVGSYLLDQEKIKAIQSINSRIHQSKNYITKTEKKLHEIENRRKYDEIANIIMANLHQIPPGTKNVELFDFYNEETIKVKLNPNLSAQKNAANYYKKSKNESIEKDQLIRNIEQKNKVIKDLQDEINQIKKTATLRELKNYTSKNENIKKTENLPYRSFSYRGYEIRVGKNASANDQLTLKYSSKNDLWLHAKDVAGSHTIIRKDHPHSVPKDVIEFAAGIAAYYSKRKTETLCPVIITDRKYVRKGKGLPPGKVIVDKEEVILVEPRLPFD